MLASGALSVYLMCGDAKVINAYAQVVDDDASVRESYAYIWHGYVSIGLAYVSLGRDDAQIRQSYSRFGHAYASIGRDDAHIGQDDACRATCSGRLEGGRALLDHQADRVAQVAGTLAMDRLKLKQVEDTRSEVQERSGGVAG